MKRFLKQLTDILPITAILSFFSLVFSFLILASDSFSKSSVGIVSYIFAVISPIVTAMFSFSYFFSERKRDFLLSAPVSRNKLFLNSFLSAFSMSVLTLVFPLILCFLLTDRPFEVLFISVFLCFASLVCFVFSGILFKKKSFSVLLSLCIMFVPYLFLSEFENRLNYLLPNFHDIKNYQNIINLEIPPILIVILTVLLLFLTVFLHKKCDFEKEYSPITFIILFSVLASVIFSFSLWNKNNSNYSTVIVVSFLCCFIPTIIKYRRPKIFLISALICLISFSVSGFVIYKVPHMYNDYCKADFNENTVKNITIMDNNCPDMKNGDIIQERAATDILLSGTQNKEGYGFILKINTNKFLPIYRYSYLDTNSVTALHSLLYKADSILPLTTAKVSFSCHNHDILNITPDLYNIFLKEISSADSKVWYSLKYPELLKNLDYGQNSYRLFINGDLYYISPAVTPDFFNNVNDRLKKTDFEKDKTYWLAGYIFQGNQKEITDIIEKASTRKITNSTNGGVWLLCDNETEKPLKLIPLTNTECETINTLLKG